MRARDARFVFGAALLALSAVSVRAQDQTVGLFLNDPRSFEGYTLLAPMQYPVTYLIDKSGHLVHTWESDYTPALSAYLLENGDLLRTCNLGGNGTFNGGGMGGRVEERSWDGSVVWEYTYSSTEHVLHHDVEPLPNGNVLMIAWERKSYGEAVDAGRRPGLLTEGELWPDHLVEVAPSGGSGGDIVWEWHLWDHMVQDYDASKSNYGVVADHPELVDLNYVSSGPGGGKADWTHCNSVDYSDEFDQILLSVHNFSEIWIIDHSTSTEEAAGHVGGASGKGGDILYRWGNPQAYDAGSSADQELYAQHDARWTPAGSPGEGNITVFNNGRGRPEGDYSTVDEITPPVDGGGNYAFTPGAAYGPEEPTWSYAADDPTDFFSQNISGAHRLPNGNTLICSGADGTFFEVMPDSEVVWLYVNPVAGDGPLEQGEPIPQGPMGYENQVFRATCYSPEYAAFDGVDLSAGCPIEGCTVDAAGGSGEPPSSFRLGPNRPNPFNPVTTVSFSLPEGACITLRVYNETGEQVATLYEGYLGVGNHEFPWNAEGVSSGVYFCTLEDDSRRETVKMVLVR